MTVDEYLASLTAEQREDFEQRVQAIGSRHVDVYSASIPNFYDEPPQDILDESRDSLDIDNIAAIYHFEGPGASSHYHILLTAYQYAYWSDPERKPVQGWLVAASKANVNWFQPTEKSDGTVGNGPYHVFGSKVFDPDEKEFVYPGKQKKQPIDSGGITEEV